MLLRRFGLDPAMWGLQVFLAADAGNSTECLTSNSQLEESMIPRLDARLPFQLWCKQIPKGSSRTPTNPTARVAVTPVQAAAAVQAARNLLTPGAVPMPAAAAPAAALAAAAPAVAVSDSEYTAARAAEITQGSESAGERGNGAEAAVAAGPRASVSREITRSKPFKEPLRRSSKEALQEAQSARATEEARSEAAKASLAAPHDQQSE